MGKIEDAVLASRQLTPEQARVWAWFAERGVDPGPAAYDAILGGVARVEALVAWEYTNAVLGSIRRPDLWDNAYVSSVVSRVGAQIGGWSQ